MPRATAKRKVGRLPCFNGESESEDQDQENSIEQQSASKAKKLKKSKGGNQNKSPKSSKKAQKDNKRKSDDEIDLNVLDDNFGQSEVEDTPQNKVGSEERRFLMQEMENMFLQDDDFFFAKILKIKKDDLEKQNADKLKQLEELEASRRTGAQYIIRDNA